MLNLTPELLTELIIKARDQHKRPDLSVRVLLEKAVPGNSPPSAGFYQVTVCAYKGQAVRVSTWISGNFPAIGEAMDAAAKHFLSAQSERFWHPKGG